MMRARFIFAILMTVLLSLWGSVWADAVYCAKSLAPGHRLQLQRSIAQIRDSLNQTRDPEPRSRVLEELCKKLIQAEEYEEALKVAREVVATEGANPERRAVHHFLIAQIYAMRMEASPTLELMELNRRMALETANEVIAQCYPKKWLVSESAQQLIRSLNDPKHLREVRGWVQKRQNDPSYDARLRLVRAQSAVIERRAVLGGENVSKVEKIAKASAGPARGTVSVSYSRAASPSEPYQALQPSATATPGLEKRKSSPLRGPIVIEGSRVHRLEKSPQSISLPPSPYAPGAEPTPLTLGETAPQSHQGAVR